MNYLGDVTQWQTWRHQSAISADTLLTKYEPQDVTSAVIAKMMDFGKNTAIALRAFGRDAATKYVDIVISGWMGMAAPTPGAAQTPHMGCGHRLWRGRLTLGTKALTSGQVPAMSAESGKKWDSASAWLEVAAWDHTLGGGYDPVGATHVEVANQEAVLILPTLGYRTGLLEIVAGGTMTGFGVLARPVSATIVSTV